jgi:hypothetical protein
VVSINRLFSCNKLFSDALSKILRNEGIRGLYRGYWAWIATEAPSSAVSFATYQFTKKTIQKHDTYGYISRQGDSDDEGYYPINIISGFIAGTVAGMVTNPIDVAKTRIQTQEYSNFSNSKITSPKYKGTLNALTTIVKEEGLIALTKGMTARVLVLAPSSALGFGIFEIVKKWSLKEQ